MATAAELAAIDAAISANADYNLDPTGTKANAYAAALRKKIALADQSASMGGRSFSKHPQQPLLDSVELWLKKSGLAGIPGTTLILAQFGRPS